MLDSRTKAGITATRNVMRALENLGRRHEPAVEHLWFPNGNTIPVDGFISRSGELAGIFEAKSRRAGFDSGTDCIVYKGEHYDDYLITKQKIEDGARISKEFGLPFFLLVYMELTGHVLSFKITDTSGEVIIDFTERKSKTQATINGSTAIRVNAYIPIKGQAKVWKT